MHEIAGSDCSRRKTADSSNWWRISRSTADAAGRATKKIVRPERRRELVRYLEWTYRVSERRGCAALRFDRSSHRYRAIPGLVVNPRLMVQFQQKELDDCKGKMAAGAGGR